MSKRWKKPWNSTHAIYNQICMPWYCYDNKHRIMTRSTTKVKMTGNKGNLTLGVKWAYPNQFFWGWSTHLDKQFQVMEQTLPKTRIHVYNYIHRSKSCLRGSTCKLNCQWERDEKTQLQVMLQQEASKAAKSAPRFNRPNKNKWQEMESFKPIKLRTMFL